jgi:hypothetical protein
MRGYTGSTVGWQMNENWGFGTQPSRRNRGTGIYLYELRKTTINIGQDSGIPAKILTEHLPNTCLLQSYRHINLLSFIVFLDVTPTQFLYVSANN